MMKKGSFDLTGKAVDCRELQAMGGAGKDSGSIDGDSAKIEISAMLKDTTHKYNEALFDNTHPKHAEAISYRDHLYDIVYAEDE